MTQPDSKRTERLLLLTVFFFWFSVYTYPSFLTSWAVNGLGATQSMAGMIVGSYGLTQMLLRIPLGIWSDLLKKRKPFVLAGLGFSLAASAGLSAVALLSGKENVSPALAVAVLLFRGMSGITAATWVNFSVLCAAGSRGDQVSGLMSRIIVPQCGSQVIAMLLGAQLAGRLGELWAFVLAFAAGIVGIVLLARVPEPQTTAAPITFRSFLDVAHNRDLLVGSLLAAVYQLVVWSTAQGFVQNWGRDILRLTTAQLGYLSVAQLLPNTIVSRFSGTVLLRRFGRKAIVAAGFCLLAAACFLYPRTQSLAALLAAQVLLGSGVGLIMPLTMSSAIETVSPEKRGAAMGFYQATYGIGMFLGPVIAGQLIERFSSPSGGQVAGYSATFLFYLGVSLLGGLLSLFLLKSRHSKA